MKSILSAFIIISMAMLCLAGIGIVHYPPNPKYDGKCPISETLVLSPGNIIKDPRIDCGQIWCREAGVAEFRICVPLGPPRGYTQGDYVDLSLPFPACCERKLIKI